MTFGGVEALLVPWLTSTLGARVVTETPDDLQDVVPLHRVVSVGGGADPNLPRFITPRVAIESFAKGYLPASDAAQAVKHAMTVLLPGQTVNGCTFTRVDLFNGPLWVGYPDTVLRQFVGTYQLYVMTT